MFYLILFFDGFPVKYFVEKTENVYILHRNENPYEKPAPLILKAVLKDEEWTIYGTEDQNLIDQLLEDLKINNCMLYN